MKTLDKVNADLQYYTIEVVTAEDNQPVICEDGEYRTTASGYAVRNKESGQVEHTTLLLPGAIFQAQHLDSTLDQLVNPQELPTTSLEAMPIEDVVAN